MNISDYYFFLCTEVKSTLFLIFDSKNQFNEFGQEFPKNCSIKIEDFFGYLANNLHIHLLKITYFLSCTLLFRFESYILHIFLHINHFIVYYCYLDRIGAQ